MRQRYIQSFNTTGDEQSAIDDKLLGKPYVALIHDGAYIDWNSKEIDYANMYLTIKARANGNLTVNLSCSYSKNGGDWTSISPKTTISIASGDEIRFKGNLDNSANGMFSGNTLSSNIYGNVLSLKYGDSFKGKNSSYGLKQMFYNYSGLKDAGNLFLPTLLQNSCYEEMFYGCTSLTTAPELPATTLAKKCYHSMFQGCRSLTIAPALPATMLADSCYSSMFLGCASLTEAPELLARNGVFSCYSGMFSNCKNLHYIKCLLTNPTTGVVGGTVYNWFPGAAASGTFVKHPNASWTTGNNGIPNGWTVIDADN